MCHTLSTKNTPNFPLGIRKVNLSFPSIHPRHPSIHQKQIVVFGQQCSRAVVFVPGAAVMLRRNVFNTVLNQTVTGLAVQLYALAMTR